MTASMSTTMPATFLWLEITGKCPLECVHCYADSGPTGTTGAMTEADWLRVIDQAADAGVSMVQFIGGEPLSHPSLAAFIEHALARQLKVEVFTNLAVLPSKLKPVLTRPGVQLATSYYSGDPQQHDAITGVRGSHKRTTRNIATVMAWGVPLRVGVIQITDDQDVAGAYQLLSGMGVTQAHVGFDRLREVGRGIRQQDASCDQLCGNCGNGNAAILPSGDVVPCVFSRWMTVGNVLQQPLDSVLTGELFSARRAELTDYFEHVLGSTCRPTGYGCNPRNAQHDGDVRNACTPDDSGDDQPAECSPKTCSPHYLCPPTLGDPGPHIKQELTIRG